MQDSGGGAVELTTFRVGDAIYGMDILRVQEINKLTDMTDVPQSQNYIKGIVNLRGQIVTVIDLSRKLGLDGCEVGSGTRNIIISSNDEYFGLLVDSIGDVVRAEWDRVEAAPANIGGVQGKFFNGVFKTERDLIGIIDVEEVLKVEESGSETLR